MADLARVFKPGTEPSLISGTAASNTAGAGTPKQNGKELGTVKGASLAIDNHDDRTRVY